MNIDDYITFIDREEDKVYLKTKLLPVNMRFYTKKASKDSPTGHYVNIIRECCNQISFLCLTKMEGYKLPHGMSGANAGIPFNIIGIAINRGKKNTSCKIMINPEIIGTEGKKVLTETNCGSIRLKEPIKAWRYPTIRVKYFDIDGTLMIEYFNRDHGAFTIQHEIDHNNGILITDL